MDIAIKLNPAERIRRAKAADPSLTIEQLRERLGVSKGQVYAALNYKPVEPKLRRQA